MHPLTVALFSSLLAPDRTPTITEAGMDEGLDGKMNNLSLDLELRINSCCISSFSDKCF